MFEHPHIRVDVWGTRLVRDVLVCLVSWTQVPGSGHGAPGSVVGGRVQIQGSFTSFRMTNVCGGLWILSGSKERFMAVRCSALVSGYCLSICNCSGCGSAVDAEAGAAVGGLFAEEDCGSGEGGASEGPDLGAHVGYVGVG
jgi:hypothetical protein